MKKTTGHSIKAGDILRSRHGRGLSQESKYEVLSLIGKGSVKVQNIKRGNPFTARVIKGEFNEGIKVQFGEYAFKG